MPTIEAQGAQVSYIEAGCGEPVVLLHSSVSSSAQWRSLIEVLQPRCHVMAPDLYGYGGSDPWPGAGRLRLADEAAIVEELVARCGGPIHLVGHSYGGAVALHLALTRPEMLRSLTVIEPVSFHLLWNSDPMGVRFYGEVRELADAIWAAVANGNYREAMARFVDYWNGAGAWARLGEAQRQSIVRAAPKVALDFWSTITEPKVLQDYAAVTAPTLLMSGGCSPAPTRRIVDLLAGTIPGASVEFISGAGHMAPLSHRDAVNEAVADHLKRNGTVRQDAA